MLGNVAICPCKSLCVIVHSSKIYNAFHHMPMHPFSACVLLLSTYSPAEQAELLASIQRNGQENIRAIVGDFNWTQDTSIAFQDAYRGGEKLLRCNDVPTVVSSRSKQLVL